MTMLYLIISFIVGLIMLSIMREQEATLLSMPIGDTDMYDTVSVINPITLIFAPSLLVIGAWCMFCFIVNSILDLF